MYKLCVFAGTTEGRELIHALADQPVQVTACVATEYGETRLHPADNLTVSNRRLDREAMTALFRRERFDLVVDATHPYAQLVTENLVAACRDTDTDYLRLLRPQSELPENAVYVEDAADAVRYLSQTRGPILLTTGSKELRSFTALPDFASRVFARVLPMEASLEACKDAGLEPARILAMQGPFSLEMNLALLHATGAAYLVTKEGGATGGFPEKMEAARQAGVTPVIIGRPAQQEGVDYAGAVRQLIQRFNLRFRPRVSVVGIGPGAPEAMTPEVRRAIDRADCLLGARRMLEAVARPGQPVYDAIAPLPMSRYIAEHPEYRRFTVVMSGDCGFFSGAKKLLPLLQDCDVRVLPGLSSLVTLCARLGESYEDAVPVSLHGRVHDIAADVRAHEKVFALVGGENGMVNLCRRLTEAGLGRVTVSVGERLSYPEEKVTTGTAQELQNGSFDVLSVALIRNPAPDAVVTHGLPDSAFRRGGSEEGVVPMTKQEVRAVSLSKLALTRRAVCWDIGAGTGSCAIEMALRADKGQVFAIERKEAALELLEYNRQRFSAENMTVVPGLAPAVCGELPAPTHVFIGGSAGNMKEILSLILKKNPACRIVATAIALETVAELTACMKQFPWKETEVCTLQVARSRKAGPYHLMTGQNPIYIFTLQGGGEEV